MGANLAPIARGVVHYLSMPSSSPAVWRLGSRSFQRIMSAKTGKMSLCLAPKRMTPPWNAPTSRLASEDTTPRSARRRRRTSPRWSCSRARPAGRAQWRRNSATTNAAPASTRSSAHGRSCAPGRRPSRWRVGPVGRYSPLAVAGRRSRPSVFMCLSDARIARRHCWPRLAAASSASASSSPRPRSTRAAARCSAC